jgi:hypothetical protein
LIVRTFLERALVAFMLATPMIAVTPICAHADWAVAFGQTGEKAWAFGTSVKPDDKAAARKTALSQCRDKGSNCKVILDGEGGCVALAVGLIDNAWAVEQRDTRLEAARIALKECVIEADGDCEVKKTFCDE